jgi:phosphoribosylaminoimidazole-succinocarboxamide synthase
MNNTVFETNIEEYPLIRRGKVRDVYDLGESLLFVASDRISAYDWILPNGIPGKGKILNSMSLFWFAKTNQIFPNHLVTGEFDSFPKPLNKYEYLDGRSMIVKKAERIDVECVARGYLIGSGYRDYMRFLGDSGSEEKVDLYGNELPADLRMADKLPAPVFTPATKEEDGHDLNISYSDVVNIVGEELASKLRNATLAIYSEALEFALSRGIIIADTKFEFGFIDGELILIDEILSPDSSRFWPVDSYKPGANPPSFDKQFIRDWLDGTGWDKNSTPPAMPDDIVEKTLEKYKQAHKMIIGSDID